MTRKILLLILALLSVACLPTQRVLVPSGHDATDTTSDSVADAADTVADDALISDAADTDPGLSCTPNTAKCEGSLLMTCTIDGGGYHVAFCAGGCQNQACLNSVCEANKPGCADNMATLCNDTGTAFVSAESCAIGCDGAACATCTANSKSCDGLLQKSCAADGKSQTITTCAVGCKDGACTSCTPSSKVCEGNLLKTCATNGSAYAVETCKHGCDAKTVSCVQTICLPSVRRCEGSTVLICNNEGLAWELSATCPYGCDPVLNTCKICQPGTKSCNGTTLKTCDPDGSSYTNKSCASGCSDGACDGECVPSEKRCSPTVPKQPQKCDDTGKVFTDEGPPCAIACSQGECVDHDCTVPKRCSPDLTTIEACDVHTGWASETTCPLGCILDGQNNPVCKKCILNSKSCLNNAVAVCTDELANPTLQTCPASHWCVFNGCFPEVKVSGTTLQDVYLSLLIAAARCWIDNGGGGQFDADRFCFILDTSQMAVKPSLTALDTWFTQGVANGTITEETFAGVSNYDKASLFKEARELLGVGIDGGDNNFFFQTPNAELEAFSNHSYCMVYDVYAIDDVLVQTCDGLSF